MSDERRAKLLRLNEPLNLYKATLTPHYFRHNFVRMLYRANVNPLKAMKIVGHSDYQTTADICTHLDEMSMRATAQDMQNVFRQVNTAARKGQYVRKEDVLAANVLQFPMAAD